MTQQAQRIEPGKKVRIVGTTRSGKEVYIGCHVQHNTTIRFDAHQTLPAIGRE